MDYAWIMLGLSWIMLAALIKKLQVPRDVLVNVPIWVSKVGCLEQWHGSTRQHGGHGVAEWRSAIFATWSFILQEGRFDLLESDQIYQASPFVFPQFLFVFYHFLKMSGIFIFPSGISELHEGFSQHFISSKRILRSSIGGCWCSNIFHIPWGEELAQAGSEVWSMGSMESMSLRHVTCGPSGHGQGEVLSVAQSGRFQSCDMLWSWRLAGHSWSSYV